MIACASACATVSMGIALRRATLAQGGVDESYQIQTTVEVGNHLDIPVRV